MASGRKVFDRSESPFRAMKPTRNGKANGHIQKNAIECRNVHYAKEIFCWLLYMMQWSLTCIKTRLLMCEVKINHSLESLGKFTTLTMRGQMK